MKKSQEKKVLSWLNSGRTLTPLQALKHGMGMRLSGRIYDLKQKGYDIIKIKKEDKNYACYALRKKRMA